MEELPSWGSFIYHSLFQHSINRKQTSGMCTIPETNPTVYSVLGCSVVESAHGKSGWARSGFVNQTLHLSMSASLLHSSLICSELRETSARSEQGHV